MAKILVIAGHGMKRNGEFDPGATGYIKKGENKYYREDFFPAVRKYLPENHEVVLFEDYNVYDRRNLVALARLYGENTKVIEMHYDATGSAAASGGHVIIHAAYSPDNLDLQLRDWIKKHIGVRYSFRGHVGISGRDNLQNPTLAKESNINYRLIELGFGTNKTDADKMVNNVDAIAKDFVMVICGKVKDTQKTTHRVVQGDTLWALSKKYGMTVKELQVLNGLSNDLIVTGQELRVTGQPSVIPKPAPVPKPAPKPIAKKSYVTLLPSAKTWRFYKLGVTPVAGKEYTFLAPANYKHKGGITYEILGYEDNGQCAVIETEMFGRGKIFIKDPEAKIFTK